MRAVFCLGAVLLGLTGCASTWFGKDGAAPEGKGRTVTVNEQSLARSVLESVPLESAMERFELVDESGRVISYIAFTDTAVGGLVFINQKLHGTVSHRDAQAFYSCRGYITALNRHWAQDAGEWARSLVAASHPAREVRLEFSGKSTTQSLQEVVKNNPFVDQVRLLVSMGSNPLGIFRTLDRMRDNMVARERYEKTLFGLSTISPGMGEHHVAEVIMPEEVAFTQHGVVMAYPSHLVEYFIQDNRVQVIQQPSFNYLSRMQITLFYVPNTQWGLCTPRGWLSALPAQEEMQDDSKQAEARKRSLHAAERTVKSRGAPSSGLWSTLGNRNEYSGGPYGATVRRGGEE